MHICPIEVAAFISSIWGLKWLWHCCQHKIAEWKCGHQGDPHSPENK